MQIVDIYIFRFGRKKCKSCLFKTSKIFVNFCYCPLIGVHFPFPGPRRGGKTFSAVSENFAKPPKFQTIRGGKFREGLRTKPVENSVPKSKMTCLVDLSNLTPAFSNYWGHSFVCGEKKTFHCLSSIGNNPRPKMGVYSGGRNLLEIRVFL